MGFYEVHLVRPSWRILGAEFGRDEMRHVLGAALALTVIFAAGFSNGVRGLAINPAAIVVLLPLAFVATAPSFVAALVAQKRVGARSGASVRYRLAPQWLAISLLFSVLFGFILAIPGTLERSGWLTRASAGRMAAAAPGVYLAVAALALVLGIALPTAPGAPFLLLLVANINAFLAAFSMLPIPGFPGLDIYRWSLAAYTALLGATVALFVAFAYIPRF